MTAQEAAKFRAFLERAHELSPEVRLSLAKALMESLRSELRTARGRDLSLKKVLGKGKGKRQPPDDEMVRKWIEEHRLEKYG